MPALRRVGGVPPQHAQNRRALPSQIASPSLPQRTRNEWGPQKRRDPGALAWGAPASARRTCWQFGAEQQIHIELAASPADAASCLLRVQRNDPGEEIAGGWERSDNRLKRGRARYIPTHPPALLPCRANLIKLDLTVKWMEFQSTIAAALLADNDLWAETPEARPLKSIVASWTEKNISKMRFWTAGSNIFC